MSWSAKALLLSTIVGVNLAVLWWRHERQVPEIPGVGPYIAALGAMQAETVISWRNAESVPLTPESIKGFVGQMNWGGCAPRSTKAAPADRAELSPHEEKSLREAVAGLIEVYSGSDPNRLYDYMEARGEALPPESVAALRRLVMENDSMATSSLMKLRPRELFLLIAERVKYDSRWESLAAEGGCITLWRTGLDSSRVQEEIPLGGSMAGLFKNQTRYHHLFQRVDQEPRSTNDRLFADVQFVVKHDRRLMSEPSAYHVRFVLDRDSGTWHPLEMIHVATISGRSPVLLF